MDSPVAIEKPQAQGLGPGGGHYHQWGWGQVASAPVGRAPCVTGAAVPCPRARVFRRMSPAHRPGLPRRALRGPPMRNVRATPPLGPFEAAQLTDGLFDRRPVASMPRAWASAERASIRAQCRPGLEGRALRCHRACGAPRVVAGLRCVVRRTVTRSRGAVRGARKVSPRDFLRTSGPISSSKSRPLSAAMAPVQTAARRP